MSEMLGTKEAAEFCGIPWRTFERRVFTWEIPHFRVGRRIYYRRDELVSWLEARREIA